MWKSRFIAAAMVYASTINAMTDPKTKDDIARIVNGVDAPEWISSLPMGETIDSRNAMYWVYRQSEHQMVGSLVRDTWVRTALGLRRIRHEKVFPDRVLVDDGKPVILPPHSN